MKNLFILSSIAGKTEFDVSAEQIIKKKKKNNKLNEVEVKKTEYKNHAKELAEEFVQRNEKDKTIIVCGGDGTLNEVAQITDQTDTGLGLIPCGTGNDFSKILNYKNFKLEDTFSITKKPIDTVRVNGKLCVNITSLGYDTEVLSLAYKYLEKNPKLGKRAYVKAVISSMKNIKPESLKLDIVKSNGEKIEKTGKYLISAICNGGYYGSGFNPAPEAKIDDGIINLVLVRELSFFEFIPMIYRYKVGKHATAKSLEEIDVKSGIISSKTPFKSNIDGDIFETDKLIFKINEKSLIWSYFKNQL